MPARWPISISIGCSPSFSKAAMFVAVDNPQFLMTVPRVYKPSVHDTWREAQIDRQFAILWQTSNELDGWYSVCYANVYSHVWFLPAVSHRGHSCRITPHSLKFRNRQKTIAKASHLVRRYCLDRPACAVQL